MITKEMITKLNEQLVAQNSALRVVITSNLAPSRRRIVCRVVLANTNHIFFNDMTFTDEFHALLAEFFARRNIKIMYNRARSLFWEMKG
jgi:hypothetical protein